MLRAEEKPGNDVIAQIRAALLPWYRAHRRSLPWREASDPYAVWVSETMLQQTQVRTVIPYFTRWMERFPTVTALAEAPLEEVLRHWAGLGYYARARHLHAAARRVVEYHGGVLPADLDALLALPGIGRYTAGAILSIAFGVRAPILDGNAIRVFSRLFLVEGDPGSARVQRRLWELAEALVPQDAPGDFNQGVMELGATVCLPEEPHCEACPLAGECAALATGRVAEVPWVRRRARTVWEEHVCAVLREQDRVLMVRRPPESLWGGLWELPRARRRSEESLAECAARAMRESVALEVTPGASLAVTRHVVTHHRITLHALAVEVARGTPVATGCDAWEWVPLAEAAADRPVSAPQARILRALTDGSTSPREVE